MSVLPSPDTFAAASVNDRYASDAVAQVGSRPGVIGRAIAALRQRASRRAVIGELQTLSDRELNDIGLGRADLARVFDADFARTRIGG